LPEPSDLRENKVKQLSASTWVEEGPTNIGFIETEHGVYLIDSGNDKESGRKLNKIIKDRNWNLKAVICTHSNADHIGGNDYFQRNAECGIYASPLEKAFIENPELETAFLWGGKEIKDLRNKFFQARPSRVTRVLEPGTVMEEGIGIIGLRGHYFDMIGVQSPDGVLFLGDSMFGEDTLTKYKIPFIYEFGEYKASIRRVMEHEAVFFVPSHGPVVEDIIPMAQANLEAVEKLENRILDILGEPLSFEIILQRLCDASGVTLQAGQYALIGSTLRSALSFLYDENRIGYQFEKNVMLWSRSGV